MNSLWKLIQKLWLPILILIGILALGVAVNEGLEKIRGFFDTAHANEQLIASITADNQRLTRRLEQAESSVDQLSRGLEAYKRISRFLKAELEGSQRDAEQLRINNRQLRADNIKLGKQIAESIDTADGIREASIRAGDRIGEAISILERYEEGSQ